MTDLKAFLAQFPTGRDISLLWLSILIQLILSIGLLLPIHPQDYWWYVRLGQEISQTGTIPTVDTYSTTQVGQPMIYHSWLAAVVLWQTYDFGGETLTVLLRAVLIAGLYLFVWQSCRAVGAGPRLATALTLLAALSTSNNWVVRPQTFSYPLFGLMLLLLYLPERHKLRWLYPLIMLAWVNLHGAFILGFGLVGLSFVGDKENRRETLLILGLMGVASLINPRGWGVWTYVLQLLTDQSVQQLATEWQPPTNDGWQGRLFFGWLLLFPLLSSSSPHKLKPHHWLWFLVFGWMALSGLRSVIWFTIILAPLTAYLLTPLIGHRVDAKTVRGVPLFNRILATGFVLFPLIFLPVLRTQWWANGPPVLSANTPVQATDWLAERPELAGPLWSHISFSSYLIFALPSRPVWSDTRLELYPIEQSLVYLDISKAKPDWQRHLDDVGINLLMVDQVEQADLVTVLSRSNRWQMLYEDERVMLFRRNGS